MFYAHTQGAHNTHFLLTSLCTHAEIKIQHFRSLWITKVEMVCKMNFQQSLYQHCKNKPFFPALWDIQCTQRDGNAPALSISFSPSCYVVWTPSPYLFNIYGMRMYSVLVCTYITTQEEYLIHYNMCSTIRRTAHVLYILLK